MSAKGRGIPAGYDIGPLIGGGYFGMVNVATHQGSGERVALKRLKAEYVRDEKTVHRFQREIGIMKKLNGHPSIVPILDGDPDELWFTMPRAEMNLQDWIARNPRLTASCDFAH